jgi:hypothetical protein
MTFCVLIPIKDPKKNFIKFIHQLNKNKFKILIINDGSKKNLHVLNQIKNGVWYLQNKNNRGKGYSLKKAFKYILTHKTNITGIITADGDGQHSIKDINKIYQILKKNNKIILGVRKFNIHLMPIPNYIGNVISRFLFNIFQKIKISDTQCGLRGIPIIYLKKSLKIRENGFQFETVFLKKFIKKNEYLECNISTIYYSGINNISHFLKIKDSIEIIKHILRKN